jgi:hypothetical protein
MQGKPGKEESWCSDGSGCATKGIDTDRRRRKLGNRSGSDRAGGRQDVHKKFRERASERASTLLCRQFSGLFNGNTQRLFYELAATRRNRPIQGITGIDPDASGRFLLLGPVISGDIEV